MLVENPYLAMLAQLVQGERTELSVEQPDFLLFREAWLAQPNRKEIVGEAGLNGRVVYKILKKT